MDKFISDEVCKDVIDNPPPKVLSIHYTGPNIHITPGMVVTPTQVKDKPHVSFEADPNAFYTLIMHDPDAPSRKNPKFGEYHHWMVVNIPGGDVSKGEEVTGYMGSGAPKDTGLHRYVFLVYKQPEKKDFKLPKIPANHSKGRPKQKVRDYVSKMGLEELVAGNFFLAEYDDYVPQLYKSLVD
ncbi:hypothetical protein BaRGS_00033398 [Batillaria attramentaria]|uniref:Uncharacterized protein n=1 Tax=Batillaria attramentaria TaxID=370345 RepID=A0ABD0JKX5_9CAEN